MKHFYFLLLFIIAISSCSNRINGNSESKTRIGFTQYDKLVFKQKNNNPNILFRSFTSNRQLSEVFDSVMTFNGQHPDFSGQIAFEIQQSPLKSIKMDQALVHNGVIEIHIVQEDSNTKQPNYLLITTPKISEATEARLYINGTLEKTISINH